MTKNTITKAVAKTVRLGTQRYAATLTVTSTGSVIPSADGAAGVLASVTGADLTNNGDIQGAYGAKTTPGGLGVKFTNLGTLTNSGTIAGGVGYAVSGAGVDLVQGGTLNNSGMIAGGGVDYTSGKGGAGVITGGGTLSNTGQILGGGSYGGSGPAGIGVDLTNATQVTNAGMIYGGSCYAGTGGDGLIMQDGGMLLNQATILGGLSFTNYGAGRSGGAGIDLVFGGTLQNAGIIAGGGSQSLQGDYGGQGGTGLSASSATVQNTALIYGGNDALGGGGTGVYLHASRLTNAGTILGGDGSSNVKGVCGIGLLATAGAMVTNTGTIAAGVQAPHYIGPGYSQMSDIAPSQGVGVELSDHATLLNDGTIAGSNGAVTDGAYATLGGQGTTGIYLTGAASATNQGQIIGGNGGNSGYSGNGAYGGNGGAGVYLTGGAILTNEGTISGGAGGSALYGRQASAGGNGGAGVLIDGGTLLDRATISGGAGGAGPTEGAGGDAVQFGSAAGTLEISKAAMFNGLVAANAGVNDALILNSGGVGTLSGLGTTNFTGFTTIQDVGDWVLKSQNTVAPAATLTVQGVLNVVGTLSDAGAAIIDNTVEVTGTGTAQLASLSLNGGTLSVGHQAALVVGASPKDAKSGMITLESGIPLTASGTIGDAAAAGIIDNAAVTVTSYGETLSFLSPVTGSGTITIGSSSTLVVAAGLHTPSVVFSDRYADVLRIEGTGSVTSILTGFAGTDTIDERPLTITSVLFANGTLTLLDGQSAVGSLFLSGNYTTASFALETDHSGGTDITLTGNDFGVEPTSSHDGPPRPMTQAQWGWAMPDHNPNPVVLAELLNPHNLPF